MLSGACVGSNNLPRAKKFYDSVLSCIGMSCHVSLEHELGYGANDGRPNFWVVSPYNEKEATVGNGTQIMFQTDSKKALHAFYDAAIKMGGVDEGAPGPREYSPNYYGAYVRDLDGNKLHISIKI